MSEKNAGANKQKVYIGVNIDWSKSFTDPNGGFYCGTTQEQKELTARLMPLMDLVIYTTDFHSVRSKEFGINGGLWPLHNVAEFLKTDPEALGLPKGASISPRQTKTIDDLVNKSKTGIIVPKHVYYQDGDAPTFLPRDVEQAFGEKIITPEQFIAGGFSYIIAPKIFFDATRTVSDYALPEAKEQMGLGIPDKDFNVFSLLRKKYPANKYDLVFINTGVVENICRHYTSTGQRQLFPDSRVINPIGATTELAGIGLGFDDRNQVKDACMRISKDINVEYKPVNAIISEIEAYRSGSGR